MDEEKKTALEQFTTEELWNELSNRAGIKKAKSGLYQEYNLVKKYDSCRVGSPVDADILIKSY